MERVLTLLKSGGFFIFFSQNHSKKNYTDGIFKKRLLRKNGPFPVLGGKNFFCGGACGRAALECAECLRGVPGACGWTFLGERGWTRWRLCMFNLIYHLLPKNHKLSRCSSGRVSVDSAAFFWLQIWLQDFKFPQIKRLCGRKTVD